MRRTRNSGTTRGRDGERKDIKVRKNEECREIKKESQKKQKTAGLWWREKEREEKEKKERGRDGKTRKGLVTPGGKGGKR